MSRYVFAAGMVALSFSALTLVAQVRETPQSPTPPKQQTVTPNKGVTTDQSATPEKKTRRSHKRVYLGVYTVPVEDMNSRTRRRLKLKDTEGVVVVEVVPDSPADEAGLRHGDVITHVNGKAIEDEEELREDLNRQGPDKPVKLSVLRDGEKRDITAKLEEGSPEDFAQPQRGPDRGFAEPPAGPDHEARMRIEHLERRISRLEKRLDNLEDTRSAKKP
ncbi:MAG TPA: PDZ domain-containing protein [Gemmataceae bacterium]|jgi:membrane-associated protease RseP (regulator of RpoE activity)